MVHERFNLLAAKVTLHEPPCMSDAEDWEAGHAWVDDLAPPPEPAAALPPMPDPAGACLIFKLMALQTVGPKGTEGCCLRLRSPRLPDQGP